ncbi:MAG: hypothetical protein HC889_06975 [Synechococcaceae cyanobacterium SM1_2_3]|nr:hypothetical protein [Synechococcaceae cyanobacterium SM1_2_3]
MQVSVSGSGSEAAGLMLLAAFLLGGCAQTSSSAAGDNVLPAQTCTSTRSAAVWNSLRCSGSPMLRTGASTTARW